MYDTLIGLWGLFVSAFISSTIAPGGSEAVLAYMVTGKNYPLEQLLIVATLANTLGAMTTWWLGMLAAKKFPVAAILPKNKQAALAMLEKKGVWLLFFSWLPVIGDAFCFAGGWLKLPVVFAFFLILLGKFCRYVMVAWMFV